jgi:hypothetical protein
MSGRKLVLLQESARLVRKGEKDFRRNRRKNLTNVQFSMLNSSDEN